MNIHINTECFSAKRLAFAGLVFSAALLFGCNPGTKTEVKKEIQTPEEIYARIEAETSLHDPVIMPEEYVENYCGIDLSETQDYVFEMSEDAASAEMVAIFAADDSEALEKIAAALENVREQRAMEMENYLPDQYDLVADAAVTRLDGCVYLVISENRDDIVKVIEAGR